MIFRSLFILIYIGLVHNLAFSQLKKDSDQIGQIIIEKPLWWDSISICSKDAIHTEDEMIL